MKFQNSKKFKTAMHVSQVIEILEDQFKSVSGSVEVTSEGLIAKNIEASFGSINRSDTTRIMVIQKPNHNILITTETVYKPSIMFWVIFIITIFTYIFWLIPIVFYLIQKKTVKQAIDDILRRAKDEVSDSELGAAPQQNNHLLEHSPENQSIETDPIKQIERLAELKQSGVLTAEEFAAKKAELLGISGAERKSQELSDNLFVMRSNKISGPFTETQITKGFKAGKIVATDKVARSKDGPWSIVTEEF